MGRKSKNILPLRKRESLLMWQPIIVHNSPQQQRVDSWHLKICEKLDSRYPGTGHFQAYMAIYSGYMSVFVCVCSHAEPLECYLCQKYVLFYEAGQTQGVIVIYEASRCLWRVQLDQKYTVPCQVHSISTSWHLLCILHFHRRCLEHNSRSK